jgi:hypothetical protein
VGINQFFTPIFIAVAVVMVLGSILSVIGQAIHQSKVQAQAARAAKEYRKRELELHAMPLKDLEAEYDRSLRAGCRDSRTWQILEARRRFDNHPDAKLFPDGASKLAEMELKRGQVGLYTRYSQEHGREEDYKTTISNAKQELERLERELAAARAPHRRALAGFRRFLARFLWSSGPTKPRPKQEHPILFPVIAVGILPTFFGLLYLTAIIADFLHLEAIGFLIVCVSGMVLTFFVGRNLIATCLRRWESDT